MRLTARSASFLVLLALVVPCGIAVHLLAEYVGLGDADEALAFSARHAYLALLACASLAGFLVAVRAGAPARERRRRVALLVAALPARGRGPRFFAAMFVAQIAFFYLTQFGEGCPPVRRRLLDRGRRCVDRKPRLRTDPHRLPAGDRPVRAPNWFDPSSRAARSNRRTATRLRGMGSIAIPAQSALTARSSAQTVRRRPPPSEPSQTTRSLLGG